VFAYYGDTSTVFWAQDYGYKWSPIGDWAQNEYKGECGISGGTGNTVTGLSAYASGQHQAHAVLCSDNRISMTGGSGNCHAVALPSSIIGPDWDFGSNKGECAANEFLRVRKPDLFVHAVNQG
jgi:hypothetical protein